MFHNASCALKSPTSNSTRSLLYSFLMTLLFCPSIVRPLAFLARTLSSSSVKIRLNIFPIFFRLQFLRHASIHQFGSQSLTRATRTPSAPNYCLSISVNSSRHVVLSQKCLLHLPSLRCESSRNHLLVRHAILMCLLLPHLVHRYLFAAAHHSVRCFVA